MGPVLPGIQRQVCSTAPCPHSSHLPTGHWSDIHPIPHCVPQGLDGAGDLGVEACSVHALFLILHSGSILDSGPGDTNSKQADVQTLSAAFEAVTRVHFPEALGHVALRLVPCPPICAAAYALVSKYWPGVGGRSTHRVPKGQSSIWGTPKIREGLGVEREITNLGPVLVQMSQFYIGLFDFAFIAILCVWVFYLHEYLCTTCVLSVQRPEDS